MKIKQANYIKAKMKLLKGDHLEIAELKVRIDCVSVTLENAFKNGKVDMGKIITELKTISDNLAGLIADPPLNVQDYR